MINRKKSEVNGRRQGESYIVNFIPSTLTLKFYTNLCENEMFPFAFYSIEAICFQVLLIAERGQCDKRLR